MKFYCAVTVSIILNDSQKQCTTHIFFSKKTFNFTLEKLVIFFNNKLKEKRYYFHMKRSILMKERNYRLCRICTNTRNTVVNVFSSNSMKFSFVFISKHFLKSSETEDKQLLMAVPPSCCSKNSLFTLKNILIHT